MVGIGNRTGVSAPIFTVRDWLSRNPKHCRWLGENWAIMSHGSTSCTEAFVSLHLSRNHGPQADTLVVTLPLRSTGSPYVVGEH